MALVGVGQEAGDFEAARSFGKGREELAGISDDGGGLVVVGVDMDELRMKRGAFRGGWVSPVELAEEFGCFGAMEVALGFGGLGVVLGFGGGAVEPEREDAVPVAGPSIEGGDVAVEGEIAGSESEWLIGCGEQQADERGEPGLRCGFSAGERAGGGGEGEVVAGGLGRGMDRLFERG